MNDNKRFYDDLGERRKFLKELNLDGMHILDIGANKAKLSRVAARLYNCKITLIDPSERKLEIAKEYLEKDKLDNRVKPVKGDIRHTQFPDHYFDCVICFNVLHHIPKEDHPKVIKEMLRVSSHYLMIAELNENGARIFDMYVHPDEHHLKLLVDINNIINILQRFGGQRIKGIKRKETRMFSYLIVELEK